MSRIRSVHPGFFRDERLVTCSAFARLLFIGLGVEADDKGIFEWKPITLKMTVFPGDNVDVSALLDELIAADAIMPFEAGDRSYGAIRNFRKFQRPKTPNDLHPMPDYVADYVAFPPKGEKPAADHRPVPPKGETSPQMEDGGEEKEGEVTPPAPQGGAAGELFDSMLAVFPLNPRSDVEKARGMFSKLKAEDQCSVASAAPRFRAYMAAAAAAKDRSLEAHLTYVPLLENWLRYKSWRDAASWPVNGHAPATADLISLPAEHPDIRALEAERGKPFNVGNSGMVTVKKADIERLRESVH